MTEAIEAPKTVPNRAFVTVSIMLASGLYALDWTIAVVALPRK